MKLLLFIAMIALASCSTPNLEHILNDFDIIGKSDSTPPLSVRILKLRDHGECNNSTCPKEQLYIAVSEFGEFPQQRIYTSPKRDSWKFISWVKHADFSENNPTAIFQVKSQVGNSIIKENISVNLDKATYIKR
jgi:hypothetical protein